MSLLLLLLCLQPNPAKGVGFEQRLNAQVPMDAVFRDESGRPVRLGDAFGGKPVVLALVYYECPMLCTVVLNEMLHTFEKMEFTVGKEFSVVTVSFNPKETPQLAAAKKATYLRSYGRPGTEAGWHFLTGEEASIKRLTEAVGFKYRYIPETGQYAHTTGLMVLTPAGRIARYFFGIDYPPRDLRLALVEASQGKIGSPVDTLLLLCLHYDPTTGRYGFYVQNIIRLGGLLTVLVLGVFIVRALLRERRKKPGG